ncbi:hypothetical protein BDR03DRAFT_942686 [Suillus americanus]|nr:hypothetical protein BDR03DRAFT_942686 [Suillus americanus]
MHAIYKASLTFRIISTLPRARRRIELIGQPACLCLLLCMGLRLIIARNHRGVRKCNCVRCPHWRVDAYCTRTLRGPHSDEDRSN